MKCLACGVPNAKGHRFCAHCGASLGVACPACGSANALNSKFCSECGQGLIDSALRSDRPTATSPRTGDAHLECSARIDELSRGTTTRVAVGRRRALDRPDDAGAEITTLVDRLRDARLFSLVTTRPESTLDLGNPARLTTLTLNRLGQRQCAALIDAVALGQQLPPEVQAEIIRKTDGVPLFVEELTKTVLQSGLLEQAATGYRLTGALPELAIPSTLQDSLMARLDRLSEAKDVAQAGAAIGREFTRGLLAQVLQSTAATQLDKSLAELEAADLPIRRGEWPSARYSFKHALVRDTAYNSMLETQRAIRHGQIAEAIERLDPDATVSQPELLAHHHQEAGATPRSIELWALAGRLAVTRGANREAAVAFQKALVLLEGLPLTPQIVSDALDVRIALAPVLSGMYGNSPAVEAAYRQALALAERLADRPRLFSVHWGLNYAHFMAGRYSEALQPARRLLDLASLDDDGGERIEAHHAMWGILTGSGQPREQLPTW